MEKIVYIVHAVDTEGPLYESTEATFERLKSSFNIELEPTFANLQKLRHREIFLNGLEDKIVEFLDPSLQNYNDSWDKIDLMLSKILSNDLDSNFVILLVVDGFITGFVWIMLAMIITLEDAIWDIIIYMIVTLNYWINMANIKMIFSGISIQCLIIRRHIVQVNRMNTQKHCIKF